MIDTNQSGKYVYTNVIDDTIHTGFNMLLEYARNKAEQSCSLLDITSLFGRSIMRIMCMRRNHLNSEPRPTLGIQDCPDRSSDPILRMLSFSSVIYDSC